MSTTTTRRRLLRCMVAGVPPLLVSGCSSFGSFGSPPDRTVVDAEFDLTGAGDAMALADEARVEWRDGEDRLVVTGFIWYGSSSCNRPTLEGVTYDGEADRLTVVTTFGQRTPRPTTNPEGVRECTADIVGSAYTVHVTFGGGLPRHVVVKQFHNGFDTTITEATR